MVTIIVLVITLPVALWMILLVRLWTLRKDQVARALDFSSLFDGTYRAREILSQELYSDEGRRLLPWARAGAVLVIVGFLTGMFLISRRM